MGRDKSRDNGDKGGRNLFKNEEEEFLKQNKEPFQKKWMNDCYKKLIFPNPKCIEVNKLWRKFFYVSRK